jgi:hypothetical protein
LFNCLGRKGDPGARDTQIPRQPGKIFAGPELARKLTMKLTTLREKMIGRAFLRLIAISRWTFITRLFSSH